MSFTNSLIYFFLILLAKASDKSELPIRRSRVLNSWQSSFGDGQTCFNNRSQADEESVLSSKSISYRFFHSAGKNEADEGFHWFAVQLSEPVLILSVTLKGREDDTTAFQYNRLIGVEIWTSKSDEVFQTDHCNARQMSSQFKDPKLDWRFCGAVNRTLGGISDGENITVSCDNPPMAEKSRILLLRKFVLNKVPETSDDDVMSFADLRLQIKLDPRPTGPTFLLSEQKNLTGQTLTSNTCTFQGRLTSCSALVFIASTLVLCILIIAFICGFLLLKLKPNCARQSPDYRLKRRMPSSRISQAPIAIKAPVVPQQVEAELLPSNPGESECSYMSLSLSKAAPNNDLEEDCASDCTVYIEIVRG